MSLTVAWEQKAATEAMAFRGVNFVMFGDGAMDAEDYGFGLAGQVRDA
jgi:hypothetical protein